jgi:hypothetical protein
MTRSRFSGPTSHELVTNSSWSVAICSRSSASGTMAGRREFALTNVPRSTTVSTMSKETVVCRMGRQIEHHPRHHRVRSRPSLLYACACQRLGRRRSRVIPPRKAAREVRPGYELGLLHFSIGVRVDHEKYHSRGQILQARNELLRHTQSLILVFITFAICATLTVHTPMVSCFCFELASHGTGASWTGPQGTGRVCPAVGCCLEWRCSAPISLCIAVRRRGACIALVHLQQQI